VEGGHGGVGLVFDDDDDGGGGCVRLDDAFAFGTLRRGFTVSRGLELLWGLPKGLFPQPSHIIDDNLGSMRS
jgi:hypothetical protein